MEVKTENGSRPSCAANTGSKTATVNKVLSSTAIDFSIRFVGRQGKKFIFRDMSDPAHPFVRDYAYYREYCLMAAERVRKAQQMVIDAEECNAALMLNAMADKIKPGFNPREYVIAAGVANVAR